MFESVRERLADPAMSPAVLVERAADLPPGPARIALLAELAPELLTRFEQVELVRLWEQCQSWMAAHQSIAVAVACRSDWSVEEDAARETVRVALAGAGTAPRKNPETALALTYCHPGVQALLLAGEVTHEQAHAVLQEVGGLALDAAREIAAQVLVGEVGSTRPSELRRRTRHLVMAQDPTGHDLDAERAEAGRRVVRRPGQHAQAELQVRGPAAQVAALFTALDQRASLTAADDDRSLDQRRFDVLIDLACADLHSPDAPTPSAAGPRRGLRPTVFLYADAATWAGLADLPVDLDGYGPIPAGQARAMMADADFRVVVADAVSGAVRSVSEKAYRPSARLRRHLHVLDRTCGFPGCGAAVWFCDVEHSTPHGLGGATDACNCGLVCRRHHRLKTFTRWRWHRDHATGRTVWTSPDGHVFHRDPVRYLAEIADEEAFEQFLRQSSRRDRPPKAEPPPATPLPTCDPDEPPPF